MFGPSHPTPHTPGEQPLAKMLAWRGKLERGGGPQFSQVAAPPSTIHRIFLYIMYTVEGQERWLCWEGWARASVTK